MGEVSTEFEQKLKVVEQLLCDREPGLITWNRVFDRALGQLKVALDRLIEARK